MNDGMLLQINRQRNLIPEDRLKAAQTIQENERAAGKPPRALLDILATRGDLDSDTVHLIRNLMNNGIPGNGNGTANGVDETVVDGFHAVVESVLLASPEPPTSGVSKSGWPQEVLDAEQDMKNLFGQFVLVAQVGSGGSGTVYRAWDRRVSRYAGLKVLHTMEPSALERFTREARIAGNLQHPSIATIYEVGEQDGRYYIAMKYIDGRPIDADPRSIPECLALIRDACRALDYAHKQGVIHRDIKPANLLVDGQDRVYVTDFGIAKQAAHDHTSTLSMTGTIIGTPKYLPPEQARGEAKRADARSDVYSVGATLYTLLAGRAPFPSSNVWETLESVMKRDPPALTSLNQAVSPELERIIAKAMAKEPSARFPSAGDLADELDRILRQRRYTGRYGLIRYLARKWLVVAAAGVLLGVLIHWQSDRFFPEEKPGPGFVPPTAETAYKMAARKLVDYLVGSTATPAGIDESAKEALRLDPKHPYAKVLQARMYHASGNWDEAEKILKDYDGTNDYRVPLILAMRELDRYLDSNPPPLPVPEAPMGGKDRWSASPEFPVIEKTRWKSAFQVNSVVTDLNYELDADKATCVALCDFVDGSWDPAFEDIDKPPTKILALPLLRKVYHRTTYLSRKWAITLRQGSAAGHHVNTCRECFGARLALASDPDAPIALLEKLREEMTENPKLELLVDACLARRVAEQGKNPESVVVAGEKLPVPGRQELRGVLWAARLRWLALSGKDTEEEYNKVLEELGTDETSTPMGQLAKMETLISRVRRHRRRGVLDPETFQANLKLAYSFAAERLEADKRAYPGSNWVALRILQAESLVIQGLYNQAFVAVPPGLQENSASRVRANLVASEAQFRLGELNAAQGFAIRATEGAKDHPVALRLLGAILLEKNLASADPSDSGLDALQLLNQAVELVPEYIEARYDRARALLLVADRAASSGWEARQNRLIAIADLTFVLERFPTLKQAETLRGYLKEHLNLDAAPRGASQ